MSGSSPPPGWTRGSGNRPQLSPQAAANHAAAIEAGLLKSNGGARVTLRRPGTPNIDVAVSARRMPPRSDGTREVIIGTGAMTTAAWPAPPVAGDQIIHAGRITTVMRVIAQPVGVGAPKTVPRYILLLSEG